MVGIFLGMTLHFILQGSCYDENGTTWTKAVKDAGAVVTRDPEVCTHIIVDLPPDVRVIPVPLHHVAASRPKKDRQLPDLMALFGRLENEAQASTYVTKFVNIGWVQQCLDIGQFLPEDAWEVRGAMQLPRRPVPRFSLLSASYIFSVSGFPSSLHPVAGMPPQASGEREASPDEGRVGESSTRHRAVTDSSIGPSPAEGTASRSTSSGWNLFAGPLESPYTFKWLPECYEEDEWEGVPDTIIMGRRSVVRGYLLLAGLRMVSMAEANVVLVPLEPGEYLPTDLFEGVDLSRAMDSRMVLSWRFVEASYWEGTFVDPDPYRLLPAPHTISSAGQGSSA